MLERHKQPSLEAGLLIILIVISVFSIGFLSEGNVTGMASTEITGQMVKVTGMDTTDQTTYYIQEIDGEPFPNMIYRAVYTPSGQIIQYSNNKGEDWHESRGFHSIEEVKEEVNVRELKPDEAEGYGIKTTEPKPTTPTPTTTQAPTTPQTPTTTTAPTLLKSSGYYTENGRKALRDTSTGKFYQEDQKTPYEGIIYRIEEIGTTKAPQDAFIKYTVKDGRKGKITSVKIDGVRQEVDMDTYKKMKSEKHRDARVKSEDDKIIFTDKKGNKIAYSFENWQKNQNNVWEGTRVKTTSSTIYLHNNQQITLKEYEKLIDEDEENLKEFPITLIEKEEYEEKEETVKEGGFLGIGGKETTEKRRVLKTYYYETPKIEGGRIIVEGVKTDIKTGNIEGYVLRVYKRDEADALIIREIELDKDGNPITDDLRELAGIAEGWLEGEDLVKEAQTKFSQLKSRQWFADLEFKLTQYKGLSGWSQLILSDNEIANWRENMDKLFSSAYLGTEYWASALCSRYIPKQQKGTFMMETRDGLFDIIAHIEAERTNIPLPNGTSKYIYKLTYYVRNPKGSRYDKLKFNVYLYGQKTVRLYQKSIEVKEGREFTKGIGEREKGEITYDKEHGKPIVQYSDFLYNKICIRFDQSIINAKGNKESEICNKIVEYAGSPEEYKEKVTADIGTPTTTDPYQEADF